MRAAILVTGTEVLTGIIPDRNGPWLSEQLRDLGIDVEMITVVGDRPEDLRGELRHMAEAGVRLIITSGGLGPTADDLTAEIVGDFCGARWCWTEALGAADLRDPGVVSGTLAGHRRASATSSEPKTGGDPDGSHGAGARGHGTRPGGSARRRCPGARWLSSCRGRRGSCSRCGARRRLPMRFATRSGARPFTAAGSCGCTGFRRPRSRTRCARRTLLVCRWPSWR